MIAKKKKNSLGKNSSSTGEVNTENVNQMCCLNKTGVCVPFFKEWLEVVEWRSESWSLKWKGGRGEGKGGGRKPSEVVLLLNNFIVRNSLLAIILKWAFVCSVKRSQRWEVTLNYSADWAVDSLTWLLAAPTRRLTPTIHWLLCWFRSAPRLNAVRGWCRYLANVRWHQPTRC